MATVRDLQLETNRFAYDENIGFEPIGCDGDLGPQTLAGVLFALTSINLASKDAAAQQEADMMIRALNSPSDIKPHVDRLTALLARGAFIMGLDYIACPTAPPPQKVLPAPKTQAAASAIDKFKKEKNLSTLLGLGLPDWVVYTGGAAFAAGVLFLVVKHKRK
ncbi:MAG: hypothetical protein ACREJC_06525 [Tepidisphaeraceae bacterium]